MQDLNDPQYWRDRAEEARSQAESVSAGPARSQMMQVAARYDYIAELVERGHQVLKPRKDQR